MPGPDRPRPASRHPNYKEKTDYYRAPDATRCFPPPWSIEERQESFVGTDANGEPLAYVYFKEERQRQLSTKRLSRDEARRIVVNIAKPLESLERPST